MRVCRFRRNQSIELGYYCEQRVVPFQDAFAAYAAATGSSIEPPTHPDLLAYLPPLGPAARDARNVGDWLEHNLQHLSTEQAPAWADVELLVPVPRPNKLFLLAGNYAQHIEEGGGVAAERSETFPYVFMKPPTTTLTDPNKSIRIPAVSPDHIDWELELAVVIGRHARRVPASEALSYVAGYTIINDISDRRFRPNPARQERPRDAFFDWLHGKWHDSFCPCGPCVAAPDSVPDPQSLELQLAVNQQVRQTGATSQQIFPVASVIEFISDIVTLEPGDIISTGTPAGVGNSSGTYLAPGDRIEASISCIGTLVTLVAAEG